MLTPHFKIECEFRGHRDDVRSICSRSGSSTHFATASRDKTIRIWNLDHDETSLLDQKVYDGHDSFVTCVKWVPEGYLDIKDEILLSGSRDRRVLVWSIPRGVVLKELNGHSMDITAVIVLKNGDIVTASQDSHICVWRNFKLLKTLSGHISSVLSLAALENSEFLSGGADGTIRHWCSKYGCLNTLQAHTDTVRSLCRVPNLGFLSASHDTTAKLWSTQYKPECTFIGHTSLVYSIHFFHSSERNCFVVTSSEDRSCKIWNIRGECVQTIVHPGCVWSVLMKGTILLTACSDGIVRKFTSSESLLGPRAGGFLTKLEHTENSQMKINSAGSDSKILSEPGSFDGQVEVRTDKNGKSNAYIWKVAFQQWELLGEVITESPSHDKHMKRNDYIFDIDVQDGVPPLKLTFSSGQNPASVAEEWLQTHMLPFSYKEKIVEFLLQNVQKKDISSEKDENEVLQHLRRTAVYIPTLSHVYFDKINFEGILARLTEFGLNEEKRNILEGSSIWSSDTANIMNAQVHALIIELLSMRVEQLFPTFDLIRKAILFPDYVAELLKYHVELERAFLCAISHPATTKNVLTAIRLASNCFGTEELLEKLIFSHSKEIFSCLTSVAEQPLKPSLCVSICTFIMNFSISIVSGRIEKREDRNEIYPLFLEVVLQLLRNTSEEDDCSNMRLIIALGNFAYDSSIRRKLVSLEIQKYLMKYKNRKSRTELQVAASETLNEISKV